jgi:sugar lactone lactonase YvrE
MRAQKPLGTKSKSLVFLTIALLIVAAALYYWLRTRPPKPFVSFSTVAGSGLSIKPGGPPDYFGVTVDEKDRIYFSDGTAGRIERITEDGSLQTIASGLNMPSGLALAPDGHLIVANTGDHTILRLNVESGKADVLAGKSGESGNSEGSGEATRLNGPVGVAVARDGRIFVADSYNDRILEISADARVRTIAGGGLGLRDGVGTEALFDTPCGIAAAPDQSLLIADTGNNRVRRITPDGRVTTFSSSGDGMQRSELGGEYAFYEPIAITVRRDGKFFVACAGDSSIQLAELNPKKVEGQPVANPVTAVSIDSSTAPRTDGDDRDLIFHRPSGLAFTSKDALIVANNGSGVLRALLPEGLILGRQNNQKPATIKAEEIRNAVPARWPFDPPEAKRDVAGTFGEIRGEQLPDHDSWFHSGFDIPGAYGETARAVYSERVTLPLAVEGAGTTRERIRLPLLGYIHLRVGRDQKDAPIGNFPPGAVTFRRDETGQITGVRVRRGTPIHAGDALGTLNRLNHVHLIAGPGGKEVNALAALRFPGLVDSTPPTIEGVLITNDRNEPLYDSTNKAVKNAKPISLDGKMRIIVRAFDQVDGNPGYRRLGLYRLGFQLLKADGSPMESARNNLVFEQLPHDPRAVAVAYAEGSQSGYEGATVFSFIVTNVMRDGQAKEEFLDLSGLAPGSYIVRVFADDFFGNRAHRDIRFLH